MQKRTHYLERIVKGFANHRRIQFIELLAEQPELSLDEICRRTSVEMKTGCEHLRRLAIAGLVAKRADRHWVRHKLTPRGQFILKFLRTLE